MTPRIVAVVVTVHMGAALALPQDNAQEDLKLLQGDWVMASMQYDGQAAPDETLKNFRRKIERDKYTVTITKDGVANMVKGAFKLDPAKKPKTIDVTTMDAAGNEVKVLGIYEIDGDMQRVCMANAGDARPTDFASPEGAKRTLIVWKRAK